MRPGSFIATAGIGSNLYLAKLAMDIVAKHTEPDQDGVRIAELDEDSFRYLIFNMLTTGQALASTNSCIFQLILDPCHDHVNKICLLNLA